MAELTALDFEETYKRLILSQYKKPNFDALFRIISKIFSDIQDNNFLLVTKFWLSDATGEQLDFLAGLWDVSRLGKTDADLRKATYTVINKSSSGTISDIKGQLKASFGATFVTYIPQYPAKYILRTDAEITNDGLLPMTPAGVGIVLGGYILNAKGGKILNAKGGGVLHVDTDV